MRAPEFWAHDGVVPLLLAPLAALYGAAAAVNRSLTKPIRVEVPVICVGNLTVGGSGKTPLALAIGRKLRAAKRQVHFLSRGYRGSLKGPVRVDANRHTAAQVGDEPLLLAKVAPTWIARDRPTGARAAIAAGADILVMDDGLQNRSLEKDLAIAVVDGGFGFGNGRLLPAGPLREPLAAGLERVDAVVLIADPGAASTINPPAKADGRWFRAHLTPDAAAQDLAGARVVAFAGIGRPHKFFATLQALGAVVVSGHAYPDHYVYPPEEIVRLGDIATAVNATLVTTAKDAARLDFAARALVTPVNVALDFEPPEAIDQLLAPVLQRRLIAS